MLHRALKDFFYEFLRAPGETGQELPTVFGPVLPRQSAVGGSGGAHAGDCSRLHADEETAFGQLAGKHGIDCDRRIHEASGGDPEDQDNFPEGRGASSSKTKDVFIAAHDDFVTEFGNDLQDALEVMTEDWQAQGDQDEEEKLYAFETYSEIRRKVTEKKRARGFTAVEPPKMAPVRHR